MPAVSQSRRQRIAPTASVILATLSWPLMHICFVLMCVSCDRSKAVASPTLSIELSTALGGSSKTIEFDGISLRVSEVELRRQSKKEVRWTEVLDDEKRQRLTKSLNELPVKQLKHHYDDPAVADGFLLQFKIQPSDQPATEINVVNFYVEELTNLTDVVDALLPKQYRLNYGLWHEREILKGRQPKRQAVTRP